MKTRPHIVTQTELYPVAGIKRSAALLAGRMETAGSLKNLLGYSKVLVRLMKMILDLTLHNDCFEARRDVLASPRARRNIIERIGGAHALLRWRRKQTWNTARLAAIARGDYHPPQACSHDAERADPAQAAVRPKPEAPVKSKIGQGGPAKDLAYYRLPVLQNLRAAARRSAIKPLNRAKPKTRFPSIVLWPYELDGQYVPDFKSRAGHPSGGSFDDDNATWTGFGRYPPPAIFAPP